MNVRIQTSTQFHQFSRIATVLAIALPLAGCMVGPDYHAPEPSLESSFSQSTTRPATTQPSLVTDAAAPIAEWWTTLRDPELDHLMQRAVAGNLSLQAAASRVRESRAMLRAAGANLTPTVTGTGGYAYVDGGKGFKLGGGSSDPFRTNLYTVGLDASWELDVFGGDRRQIEAAAADYEATIDARRGVMTSLLAEVARDYLSLRGLQKRLAIAQENLALQQDTLEFTQLLRKSGFNTQLDVSRATTEVAQTKAQIVPLTTEIVQVQHALAVLLGDQPDALSAELNKPANIAAVPPSVSIGLPADLLRRRPDLRRAERQLAAANARIGAAVSDYYPKFSLTGAFGTDSNEFKPLFNASSRYFVIYPSVSWKLLDFGRTKANVDAARERYEQAWLGYQDGLLTALHEVEDSIIAYSNEQDHHAALAEAVASAKDSVDISRDQYKQGLVDFLQVIDTQRRLLVAQDQLAQSDQAISVNLVALYKSLGGGWEVDAARQLAADSGAVPKAP